MLNCNFFSIFFSLLLLSGFGSCIRKTLLAKEEVETTKSPNPDPGILDLLWGDARDACNKISKEPTLKTAYEKLMQPINEVSPEHFEHLRFAVFVFLIATDKFKIEVGQKLDPSIFEGRSGFKEFMEERLQHLLKIPTVDLSEPLTREVVEGINNFKALAASLCSFTLNLLQNKLQGFIHKLNPKSAKR